MQFSYFGFDKSPESPDFFIFAGYEVAPQRAGVEAG